jgi:hypothetical protein
MTGVALRCGHKMVLGFARGGLVIVTSGALTGRAGIVNIARGDPGCRLMAGVALRGSLDVVLRLARGRLAVMAGGALTGYHGKIVIKGCRRPGKDGMTNITSLGRHNVILRFSIRDLIIMAIFAFPRR